MRSIKCEFCNIGFTYIPEGFVVNDDWWHICSKCKAKVLGLKNDL
jgi:hypothetical protein